MSKFAVKLKDISKKYDLQRYKPTLIESLSRADSEDFWALKNIDLEIKKGERLGLIGPNGAGKTTLLEIIAGITVPTDGDLQVEGKLTSVIDLEAGFHPELSGRENIYLNSLLMGMSKDEAEATMEEMIAFSEIGKFIDSAWYTYSSGMRLRLAFSVAIYQDFDILVLDENMSVGDQEFVKKSFNKLKGLLSKNKTLIFASHSFDMIEKLCQRVIVVKQGEIIDRGSTKKILDYYRK